MTREEEIKQELYDHTLNGHAPEVKALTQEGLQLGMDPMDILFKALIPSLEEVGRRFEKGEFFVPEMLIAARAMQGALVLLRPLIAETGAKPIGKYVIGTVKGDIHDIGKNLVVIMLEGAGFEVVDLGVNTAPEKFVDAVRQHEPHIVGFSAFLTTTMPMFKVNIEALQKAGLRDKVTVMVGGAPVTEEYAKQSGADFYAADASLATRMAKTIVGASQSPESLPLRQAVELIDKTLRKG
jgi:5-methyltetrahydrofolate--homocysteine methyltransferase